MFRLETTGTAFAPSPSPRPNAAHVILSGASRFPHADITPLVLPSSGERPPAGCPFAGQQSPTPRQRACFTSRMRLREVPLRFCPASSITKAAVARNIAKFPEMRTYENREPNAFKISTSKTHDLNRDCILHANMCYCFARRDRIAMSHRFVQV
jgi:hypothetical protein